MNAAARSRWLRQDSKRLLFLKKKKQKDFARWGAAQAGGSETSWAKFFGSFFQERTRFLLFLAHDAELWQAPV